MAEFVIFIQKFEPKTVKKAVKGNRAWADINMTYTVRTASVDLGEKIC